MQLSAKSHFELSGTSLALDKVKEESVMKKLLITSLTLVGLALISSVGSAGSNTDCNKLSNSRMHKNTNATSSGSDTAPIGSN